ncbi:MAG: hypothetical protein U0103_08900 [Candidatus Obscuribacterales bacterium]|nr:hypothetical protein [Cyanobacteria bacterium SZAS LIN-5]
MPRPLIGVSIIFVVTAILIFICGFFSLGTFPLLPAVSLLLTALLVTGLAWLIYSVVGVAVCLPLRVERPGLALPTVLGTVAGAGAIAITGWLFPTVVTSQGWLAAVPFAFVNTIAVWGAAYATGYLKTGLTFWPVRRKPD